MKSMICIAPALAGAAGLVLSAGQAAAQPPAADGGFNWSGVYVGLNTGWNGADTHASSSTVTVNQLSGVNNGTGTVTVPPTTYGTPPLNYDADGWAGGGQLGFNQQTGHFVWGLEGDMDAVTGRASAFSAGSLPATALTTGSTVSVQRFASPDWTASIRGRLGWAVNNVLFYGTGGVAFANLREGAFYAYEPTVTAAVAAANPGATFGPYGNGSSQNRTLTGWTLGAGGEVALNKAVSVGLEYRYSDYGHSTYVLGSDAADSSSEAARLGITDNQVLAKVNFHFGNGLF